MNEIRIFDGATAVITGGASGIGRALGEALTQRGCEVVLADRQIELAEEVVSKIGDRGGTARAVALDVTDYAELERIVRETHERTGRLDYMFNNAGISIVGNVDHYGIEDWNQLLDVNLRGVVNGIQAAYPIMVQQRFGHIVNTSSVAGLMPAPGGVAYAAAKHAIVGLSQSLRAEASRFGVRVSTLCPGAVRTPILEGGGKYGRSLVEIPPDKMRAMWEKVKPIEPEVFAQKTLPQIASNRAIIVVPSWWQIFWWINRLSPSLGMHLALRNFRELQKQLGVDRAP